jgi:hypothetical protein
MTQQWKPIGSAPKDGTEIIVFHPEAGVCAAFCPDDGFAWHCMDGMNTVVGSKSGKSIPVMTSFLKPPTHWMPLPSAPGTPPASAQDEQTAFDVKLGAHVREWARRQGWKPEDAEGAWEFAQRLSYEAGRRHATPYWASAYEEQDNYDQAVADAIRRVKVRIEFAGRADISFPMAVPENRVYLAGPMTGYENHNFPAFHGAAERMRASGLEVVNPADHGVVDGLGWADYMRWDLVKLAGCHSVYVLPGWQKSKGASLEVAIAQALGMPVFTVEGAPVQVGDQENTYAAGYYKGHRDALAIESAKRNTAPAAGNARLLEFVREVAQQKPEKPDYWSSCGQCASNISQASDLLDGIAASQQQEG